MPVNCGTDPAGPRPKSSGSGGQASGGEVDVRMPVVIDHDGVVVHVAVALPGPAAPLLCLAPPLLLTLPLDPARGWRGSHR